MELTERLLPISGFSPVPMRRYSFRSTVVASSNDPYCSTAKASVMAEAWGADLIHAGAVGHINADSVDCWNSGREIFLAQLSGTDSL